jgi:predicted dehydrogenase
MPSRALDLRESLSPFASPGRRAGRGFRPRNTRLFRGGQRNTPMNMFSRARNFGLGNIRSGGDGRVFSSLEGSAIVAEPSANSAAFTPVEAEAKEKLPRVGFLGVGWIGRNRMEAVAKTRAVEIVGIADAAPDHAAQARTLAPRAEVVTSIDELFRLNLDGVVIATPSAMHAEQCVAALERGIAVFCQKPLARNAPECRRVVEAARASNCLLGVDLSYRHTAGMRKIRELIRGGALGRIFAVDAVFHNAYGPDKQWFYDPKLSGGGCVIDLGIHLVDLAFWTMNFPRVEKVSSRLFAQGAPLRDRARQVEDFATARLDLANDATMHLECSWRLHAGCEARIEAAFYGTEGGAIFRNINGSFYDFQAELFRGTKTEKLASPPDTWGGRAAAEWATRLASGARFDSTVDRLVQVAATLDSIYES